MLAASMASKLRSPRNGEPLSRVGPELVWDGETLWPVFDDCFYLRANRESLIEDVVELIRRGNLEAALVVLLCDRRDSSVPAADSLQVRRLLDRTKPSFEESVDSLQYGDLGWYFLHRWILPTYLSGRGLLERHATPHESMLEVGAGVGHLTYTWEQTFGAPSVSSDVVFAHLWLSRRFLRRQGLHVCFDANYPFPFADSVFDSVLCHDALHYFEDSAAVVTESRRVTEFGALYFGHVHDSRAPNFSAGRPLPPSEYRALIRPDFIYDDEEITRAVVEGRSPKAVVSNQQTPTSAWSYVVDERPFETTQPRRLLPRAGGPRVNPLFKADGKLGWPNERVKDEFVAPFPYMSEMRMERGEERGFSEKGEHLLSVGAFVDVPNDWYRT